MGKNMTVTHAQRFPVPAPTQENLPSVPLLNLPQTDDLGRNCLGGLTVVARPKETCLDSVYLSGWWPSLGTSVLGSLLCLGTRGLGPVSPAQC